MSRVANLSFSKVKEVSRQAQWTSAKKMDVNGNNCGPLHFISKDRRTSSKTEGFLN